MMHLCTVCIQIMASYHRNLSLWRHSKPAPATSQFPAPSSQWDLKRRGIHLFAKVSEELETPCFILSWIPMLKSAPWWQALFCMPAGYVHTNSCKDLGKIIKAECISNPQQSEKPDLNMYRCDGPPQTHTTKKCYKVVLRGYFYKPAVSLSSAIYWCQETLNVKKQGLETIISLKVIFPEGEFHYTC